MLGTVAGIIAVSTLALSIVLSMFTSFSIPLILASLTIVVAVNVLQWLFAPYIIEALYRVRHVDPSDPRYGWLASMIRDLATRCGLSKIPTVGIAEIDIPNAFAYESPLTGPRVAVTRRMLQIVPRDELEAVLAHELGHIKHRDVVVMMLVSILPALAYWLGYVLMRMSFYASMDRERSASPLLFVAVGALLVAISFLLKLFVLHLSRLREYYADSFAVQHVVRGGTKLRRALARILVDTGRVRPSEIARHSKLRMLFIEDPEHSVVVPRGYSIDRIVEEIERSPPKSDILSTHPHPAKRFRFLKQLDEAIWGSR